MPRIVAVGTAVPPYHFDQQEIRHSACQHFQGNLSRVEKLRSVFDNVEVKQRFFCVPLDWFLQDHTFTEKNEKYIFWSQRLSIEAIENCLNQAHLGPDDIDHLIFVSTSGMSTPSIDAHIINKMKFSPHTKRTPIFGLGCAGGAAGLSRCLDLARGAPRKRILLVAVELSSLTFQHKDFSKSNFIASALFSDGAAAVVVCGDQCPDEGIRMVDTYSTLWPDTLDIMGWEFSETGLSIIFSPEIPQLLNSHIQQTISEFLTKNGIALEDLSHFAIHPGGAKILHAFERSLGLNSRMLASSRSVLKHYGNMSSSTVIFILEHLTRKFPPDDGTYGLCAAFGPGFSSELILLKW